MTVFCNSGSCNRCKKSIVKVVVVVVHSCRKLET